MKKRNLFYFLLFLLFLTVGAISCSVSSVEDDIDKKKVEKLELRGSDYIVEDDLDGG